jgi:hypothetical protein
MAAPKLRMIPTDLAKAIARGAPDARRPENESPHVSVGPVPAREWWAEVGAAEHREGDQRVG